MSQQTKDKTKGEILAVSFKEANFSKLAVIATASGQWATGCFAV